jgi:glycosyltransferase involved in cell wall biosynthesis
MSKPRPVILIGPTCDDPAESVSAVNLALVDGLQDRYTFVCSAVNRRHGLTRQSQVNFWNLYYLLKHLLIWFMNILKHRPKIAHYAISSGMAMEKGLVMLGLARNCGARTVGHLHSGGFIDHWNTLSPMRRRFASAQLARLDAFIVLSETWRSLVVQKVGIPMEKIHIVNNPIAAGFEGAALGIPIERLGNHILSLGTMGRDKGVLELVGACAAVAREVPDFTLDIVGPEREPGIRDLVSRQIADLNLGGQVRLQESVHGDAKLDLFRDASIFVLPSHYENFPLVVLEAAAAGHAIITTPVGAVPEFFEDGVSAIFVEICNSAQLADAITRLIRNPGERQRLANRAREVFRGRLSRGGIMESLRGVYERLLGNGAAKSSS